MDIVGKWDHDHGSQGRDHGQDRGRPVQDAIHSLGDQELLGHQLKTIGQGLEQSMEAYFHGAGTALDTAGAFTFEPAEVGGIESCKGHEAYQVENRAPDTCVHNSFYSLYLLTIYLRNNQVQTTHKGQGIGQQHTFGHLTKTTQVAEGR